MLEINNKKSIEDIHFLDKTFIENNFNKVIPKENILSITKKDIHFLVVTDKNKYAVVNDIIQSKPNSFIMFKFIMKIRKNCLSYSFMIHGQNIKNTKLIYMREYNFYSDKNIKEEYKFI